MMTKTNQKYFNLKISNKIIWLLSFYLVCILVFVGYYIYKIVTDNILIYERDGDNTYLSIDTKSNLVGYKGHLAVPFVLEIVLLPLMVIVSSLVFIFDKNPFVFSNKIKNKKYAVPVILLLSEISEILIIVFLWYFFIVFKSPIRNNIAVNHGSYPSGWYETSYNSFLNFFNNPEVSLSYQSNLIMTTIMILSLSASLLLSYVKCSVFSRKTRILFIVPFMSLIFFFINNARRNSEEKNIVENLKTFTKLARI
ncbi:hypothetical protein [Mycoplasma bradburyae]|nr:hypothetical protein [Mycoplasma bradburyae]UTS70759.1 hypothetical protein NMG77_03335 [Mycoplasma bradburyae]